MYDSVKAERAVRFIEYLKHTDDFHGQPFTLLPWQRSIVSDVYGTLNTRGVRQFRYIYVEIPKKNGKSQLVSAIANLHLFDKSEPNGQIYGCAGDRAQASLVFDSALEMIEQEPALKKRVKVQESYKRITNKETGTFYQVVSAESYTKHGLNVSVCLFDELHVQPNADLWNVMTKGSGLARKQPLYWVITTAGDDPERHSIGWEIHEKAAHIIGARDRGDVDQDIPTWYPVIYSYEGEDIYNPINWAKANPSLGTTIQLEDMQALAAEAKLRQADERTFRWLNLNQWITTKLSGWLPIDLFDASGGDWSRTDLLGRDCYLGLDLSTTTDLSALALVFPPQQWEEADAATGAPVVRGFDDWRVVWDAWIPADNMAERIRADKVPYDVWAGEGWLRPTEGDVVDYTAIEERIQEVRKLYNVIELDADKSFATMLLQRLEQDNLTCVDIPQRYETLTDPMNTIEVLMRNGQLTHEPNPVARWCFGNTSIAKNGNAQIKYVKERRGRNLDRSKRIDLVAAWVCAMARAKFYASSKSVYETRGLRTL
jgi:phage terminase large subunit-like protein